MSRHPSSMKALEIRKALLISEAEVLRNQLSQDMALIRLGFGTVQAKAKSAMSLAAVASSVIAAFSAFRWTRKRSLNGARPSLLSTVLSGARAASAVWLSLHQRRG